MHSVEANGAVGDADLVLALENPTAADRDAFEAFRRRHGMRTRLVGVDLSDIVETGPNPNLPRASLMRLTLPRFLEAGYERVLYIDADALVLRPLGALLAADLGGQPLGAVPDVGMFDWFEASAAAHKSAVGLQPGAPYFNAGVLLLDWPQIRREGLLEAALARFRAGAQTLYHDQDVLNFVARGRWQPLDHRWNVMTVVAERVRIQAGIVHFAGLMKPWLPRCAAWAQAVNRHYLAMLAGTPFEGAAKPRDRARSLPRFRFLTDFLKRHITRREKWRSQRETYRSQRERDRLLRAYFAAGES